LHRRCRCRRRTEQLGEGILACVYHRPLSIRSTVGWTLSVATSRRTSDLELRRSASRRPSLGSTRRLPATRRSTKSRSHSRRTAVPRLDRLLSVCNVLASADDGYPPL
jgi:hypothetical protein